MQVRTRFAPSPTGYLHVGGARTALFNYLFAKKHGGVFVMRVEDTDAARNTEEARAAIFSGLAWLGLTWDEGEGVGGDFGPYNQSERMAVYDRWFEVLREKGRVYEDGGAWRFRFERKAMTMHDLVCGEVTINYEDESNTPDMVVKRSDGSYVFHFVNVVDDLEMKITHVIRGEDHLMNTPKHLQLFEAFGVAAPHYAHIPLILNADGSKMSKRDAGAAVGDYPKRGFASEAVVNFLALLGWSPKSEEEIFSLCELGEKFSLEGVNRSPAKFDLEKCEWVNQQHLLRMSPEEFFAQATPFLSEKLANFSGNARDFACVSTVREKVRLLADVPDAVAFYYDEAFAFDDAPKAKLQGNAAAAGLLSALANAWSELADWSGAAAKSAIEAVAAEQGVKAGALMFPVRVALSGRGAGPDLVEMIDVLGQAACVARVQRTLVEVLGQ